MSHTRPTPVPLDLSLDQCLKCNICTASCPVSAVTDRFPGPKYEGPQAGRFRQGDQFSPDRSVDYCSGCRVCNMVCPAGVKIAELNACARARMVEDGQFPGRLRLRNNLVARAALLGQIASPVAPLANAVVSWRFSRWVAQKTLGIHPKAPFPAFSRGRFSAWFSRHIPANAPSHGQAETRGQVAYFHGCSTQYYEPRIGRAAVRVLEHNGFEVAIPRQNCCGLPLLSNGEFGAARRYHQGNVGGLAEWAQRGVPIVGTSTSCTLTLKEEAPELLDLHDEETRLVARSVYDFNEFLLLLYEEGKLQTDFRPIPLKLGYHIPCQYRAHRIGKPGLEVLGLIPGLELVESPAACCGIAGTYGYKDEKYDIAMKVGQPLFDFARSLNAPVIICDSETCRWQITHATGIPAIHPVELLAVAYGFEPEGALKEVYPRISTNIHE